MGFVLECPGAKAGSIERLPNQMSPHLIEIGPKTAYGNDDGIKLMATSKFGSNRILGRRFALGTSRVDDENPKSTTWKGYFEAQSRFVIRIDFRGVSPVELGALCFLLSGTTLRVGAYKSFGYGAMSSTIVCTVLGPKNGKTVPTLEDCRASFLKDVRTAYGTGSAYPLFVRYVAALTGAQLD